MKIDLKHIFPNKLWLFILIFVITFISRIIFSEKYFFDGDTVGVALGSISYSLQNTRPHLPGYYLHVKLITIINLIIKDVHLTMVLLSAFYSSFGAVLSFILLEKWFKKNTALYITTLIIFNPLVWFQGTSTEIYSFDLVLSASLVLLGMNKNTIYLTPILLALGSGVRQTSGLLLFPLYILLWWQKISSKEISWKRFTAFHLAGIFFLLVWFLPMINSAGGLNGYISLYKTNSPLPNINLMQNIFQFSSYCFFVLTPLLIILLSLLFKRANVLSSMLTDKNLILLFAVWLVPSLLTFILFTYNKGYFLISVIPLYAFVGIFFERGMLNKTIIYLIIAIEILFFVASPYRELPVVSLLSPQKRNNNLAEIWVDRTFSSYLMSASRIYHQDQMIKELSNLIMKQKPNTVFLDPTIYLAARGLQIRFPEIRFFTMDFYNNDAIIDYKGLDVSAKHGMCDLLKNCLLITRRDFFETKLKFLTNNELVHGEFVSMKIPTLDNQLIFNLYQDLFLRTSK
ncbi:MAG: hypothetical protein ACYC4T_13175 [Melioribacteraceae bacterium]